MQNLTHDRVNVEIDTLVWEEGDGAVVLFSVGVGLWFRFEGHATGTILTDINVIV